MSLLTFSPDPENNQTWLCDYFSRNMFSVHTVVKCVSAPLFPHMRSKNMSESGALAGQYKG